MIFNPDPTKFAIRKLRRRHTDDTGRYVLVPISILRRRKRHKEILSPLDNKRKLGRPVLSQKDKLRKLFK